MLPVHQEGHYRIWEYGADYVLGILKSEFDAQAVTKCDLTRPDALPD